MKKTTLTRQAVRAYVNARGYTYVENYNDERAKKYAALYPSTLTIRATANTLAELVDELEEVDA